MKKVEIELEEDMPCPKCLLLRQGKRLLKIFGLPEDDRAPLLSLCQLDGQQKHALLHLAHAAAVITRDRGLENDDLEEYLEVRAYFENADLDQLTLLDLVTCEHPALKVALDLLPEFKIGE